MTHSLQSFSHTFRAGVEEPSSFTTGPTCEHTVLRRSDMPAQNTTLYLAITERRPRRRRRLQHVRRTMSSSSRGGLSLLLSITSTAHAFVASLSESPDSLLSNSAMRTSLSTCAVWRAAAIVALRRFFKQAVDYKIERDDRDKLEGRGEWVVRNANVEFCAASGLSGGGASRLGASVRQPLLSGPVSSPWGELAQREEASICYHRTPNLSDALAMPRCGTLGSELQNVKSSCFGARMRFRCTLQPHKACYSFIVPMMCFACVTREE